MAAIGPDESRVKLEEALTEAILDVCDRRNNGEVFTDEQVAEAFPHLMPELLTRLNHPMVLSDLPTATRDSDLPGAGADGGEARGGKREAREEHGEADRASRLSPPASAAFPRASDEKALDETQDSDQPQAEAGGPKGSKRIGWSQTHGPGDFSLPGYSGMKELRRGGQATVFSALQDSTGQRVAIKVIHGGRFLDERQRKRFLREIALLASLSHHHIVSIITQGESASGAAYLVMKYIDGVALDQYVQQWRQSHPDAGTAPEHLLQLFVKIARAVDAAHQRGVVHRDLKPSNIMVTRFGEPCLLDFGLATSPVSAVPGEAASLELTQTGQFLGSLPWASPEQAAGHANKVDARSDVYTLGLLLYNMLTGAMPYKVNGSLHEVINNIVSAQPTPLSESLSMSIDAANDAKSDRGAQPPAEASGSSRKSKGSTLRRFTRRYRRIHRWRTVHPCLEAVVLLALAKAADGRYAAAGAMAEDMDLFLHGKETLAWQKRKKRKRRTGLMVAAVLLISSMIAVASIPALRGGGEKEPSVAERLAEAAKANPYLALATPWNGHSYYRVDAAVTWDQAKETAKKMGGYLAVVNDYSEQLFLYEFFSRARGRPGFRSDWIGFESDGDQFFKSVNGEVVEARFWSKLVPMPKLAVPGGVADNGASWRVVDKTSTLGFLVEWDKLPPQRKREQQRPGVKQAEVFNGHRYLVVNDAKSWVMAQNYCVEMGGDLVTIESEQENQFVSELLRKQGVEGGAWIGASFFDGKFAWTNGVLTDYRKWAQDPKAGIRTYAMLIPDQGWAVADPKTASMPFVCEWE